jgi:hypothetical protein
MFEQMSAEAWATLFFQICRIFVFGKFNMKPLKELLEKFGIDKKRLPEKWGESNMCSTAEAKILYFFKLFADTSLHYRQNHRC